jgi:hypothetical protein
METDAEKAVRLLNEQLKELESVRGLNYKDAQFKAWRDTTRGYLERFLPPTSPHLSSFRSLSFLSPTMSIEPYMARPGYISREDQEQFRESCRTAEATIRAVLKYIGEFGVHVEPAGPVGGRGKGRSGTASGGSVHQTFNAPVSMNQAIATDNAIQKIGQVGDATGASLREIADLLKQSQDLTPRQVNQGLADIEGLASEIPKPRRDWQRVIDCGQGVLSIADKATDLAHKLAPHKETIVALVQTARHALGM